MADLSPDLPAPHERADLLVRMRRLKMARSAHAYMRGATAKFYEWLEAHDRGLPAGPPIWICGDCHVGNLGPLADGDGQVAIQIRDLDQTVIGNPAHDLIRLGLSLASAARGFDLPGAMTARMIAELVDGYRAGLSGDTGVEPAIVAELMGKAARRRWRHLAAERIADVRPALPLGKRFWPLSDAEAEGLADLFAGRDVHELVTRLGRRDAADTLLVRDAAYWIKGCSSLGRLRYAVLAEIVPGGSGQPEQFCLVDVKEGAPAAAPRAPNARMPRENADRVVAGARALSPHLGDRMLAARFLDRSVVVRELMPQDLKIEADRLSREDAASVARYLAGVVGRAHGRQMSEGERKRWRSELGRTRSKTLDVPGWLWSSVVDLMASHEAGYLDHCRRYALAARETEPA